MTVSNLTPYPHLYFRTAMDEKLMAVAMIVRVTYDIIDGQATPAAEQFWQLNPAPWQSPYGIMESDYVFQRGGVDVMVFGHAKAYRGVPTQRMEVNVSIPNKLNHSILVIGNRMWQQTALGLKMTEPEPFVEMPLYLSASYGGRSTWDGLQFPYSNNPFGKGFIWEKLHADGVPLPNVENPKQLIAAWDDRPHPVGICQSVMCEERLKRAVTFDQYGIVSSFKNTYFNQAFPDMVVDELLAGETITIQGMSTNGQYTFTLPEMPLFLDFFLGTEEKTRALAIDQVGIEPNINRAFITYRYAFNYEMKPHVQRYLKLHQ